MHTTWRTRPRYASKEPNSSSTRRIERPSNRVSTCCECFASKAAARLSFVVLLVTANFQNYQACSCTLSRLLVPRNWAKGQLRSCKRGYTSPMVKNDLHKAEAVAFREVSRGPATYTMYLNNISWVFTFKLYFVGGIARTCSLLICRHPHCRIHCRVAKDRATSSKRNPFGVRQAIGSRLWTSPKHDR